MRLVFAGTPEFAARSLEALLAAGYQVPLALTQPDRPAGRGMRPTPSAVKSLALARGIEVFQPESLKGAEVLARLAAVKPDVLVVVAYGLLLPAALLALPRFGALNIHASLLPRWRGAAPIQHALLAGDRETGVTIMQMDAGLDTGPVLAQRATPIAEDDDAGSLHDRLASLGAQMIVAALRTLAAGGARAVAQSDEGATYAPKLWRADAQLDWRRDAAALARQVRALRPAPGAAAVLSGEPVKIWRARAGEASGAPGEVLRAAADGIVVACGTGALAVEQLQRAGGKRLDAASFLRGHPLGPGARFTLPGG
jgi:methionyl-tRNA formyltransferase